MNNPSYDCEPFASFEALQTENRRLSQFHPDRELVSSGAVDEVKAFICRVCATGTKLFRQLQRSQARSIIDFWSLRLSGSENEGYYQLALFEKKTLEEESCPYIGLDAFTEETKEIFHGREQIIAQALDLLTRNTLIEVVGSSGSGKSSLVRGGILPRLKEISGQVYTSLTLTPGREPLSNLVGVACPDLTPEERGKHLAVLYNDPRALTALLRKQYPGQKIVLVIDQFEEIFTLSFDDKERSAFAANVLVASKYGYLVLLTRRSDFTAHEIPLPKYREEWKLGNIGKDWFFEPLRLEVTELTQKELRDAIVKPAETVELEIEEQVIDSIVGELLGKPSGLPLLQFALLKLWEHRDGNIITYESYKRLGGVRNLLANEANGLYNGLLSEEENAFKRVLLRMVQVRVDRDEFTSRRATRAELHEVGGEPRRVDTLLTQFVDARLIRETKESHAEEDQFEVAHESLLRNWPVLAELLQKEKSQLRVRRLLIDAVNQWQKANKGRERLWSKSELEQARPLTQSGGLTKLEWSFLSASIHQIVRQKREEEEAAAEKLRQAQALAKAEQARADEQQRRADAEAAYAEEQRLRADSEALAATKLRRRAIFIAVANSVALLLLLGLISIYLQNVQLRNDAAQAPATIAVAETAAAARATGEASLNATSTSVSAARVASEATGTAAIATASSAAVGAASAERAAASAERAEAASNANAATAATAAANSITAAANARGTATVEIRRALSSASGILSDTQAQASSIVSEAQSTSTAIRATSDVEVASAVAISDSVATEVTNLNSQSTDVARAVETNNTRGTAATERENAAATRVSAAQTQEAEAQAGVNALKTAAAQQPAPTLTPTLRPVGTPGQGT